MGFCYPGQHCQKEEQSLVHSELRLMQPSHGGMCPQQSLGLMAVLWPPERAPAARPVPPAAVPSPKLLPQADPWEHLLCKHSAICCAVEASRLVQKQVWCQSSLVSKQVEGRIGKQPALFWASPLTHGAWTSHAVPHRWLALRVSFGLQFGTSRLYGRMLAAGIWLAGGNWHGGMNPSVGFMLDSWFAVEAPPLTCFFSEAWHCQSCKNMFFLSDEAWISFSLLKFQWRITSLAEMMLVELLLWWCANSILIVSLDSSLSVSLTKVCAPSLRQLLVTSCFKKHNEHLFVLIIILYFLKINCKF